MEIQFDKKLDDLELFWKSNILIVLQYLGSK